MRKIRHTWAISDVHGCYNELVALLQIMKQKGFDNRLDRLVFLGDYIDRGPDSAKVIDLLMSLEQEYSHNVFLYGNHEDLLIDWLVRKVPIYGKDKAASHELWWLNGGVTTRQSYIKKYCSINKNISDYERALLQTVDVIDWTHINWIMQRPRFFEDESCFFVHAGLPDGLSLSSFCKLIKNELRAGQIDTSTLAFQSIWIRNSFIDSKHDWGKKVVFGHTADYNGKYNKNKEPFFPIVMENKIGIDCAVCPPARKYLVAYNTKTGTFLSYPDNPNL